MLVQNINKLANLILYLAWNIDTLYLLKNTVAEHFISLLTYIEMCWYPFWRKQDKRQSKEEFVIQ